MTLMGTSIPNVASAPVVRPLTRLGQSDALSSHFGDPVTEKRCRNRLTDLAPRFS